tara:strand:+ start:679 stop:921 length:243 start_codon:yes stop_codon:yes gene_type:complete
MIQGVVISQIVKAVLKSKAIKEIIKYKDEPNDADHRIDELEIDVFNMKRELKELQNVAHEPREFVRCSECNQKIMENKDE